MEALLIFLVTGAVAGLLAGMFGIGGGMIMVPVLAFALAAQDVGADLSMHLALGTSLAVIAVTSISSTISHHRRGAVLWPLLRSYGPGLAIGALIGAFLAAELSGVFLRRLIGVSTLLIAWQLAVDFRIKVLERAPQPKAAELAAAGGIIGLLSSLIGIGGGSLTAPYLNLRGVDMLRAIGTAAAGGVPIAWAGALGYAIAGWNETGLPAPSLGYISLTGFASLAAASVLVAPLGARLAHALPPRKLQLAFAVLLTLIGLHMLLS